MPAPAHQLFVAHVAFGHCRPMLYLALNLLSLHPHLSITMLASKQLASKLLPQLDRYGATEEVLSRFHFVFFGEVDNADGAGLIQVLDLDGYVVQTLVNFQEVYPKILRKEPLFDTHTQALIPTFTAPLTRVFSDLLLLVGVAPMKAGVEKELNWPAEKRVGLVSSCPLNSSFVAAYWFNSDVPGSIIPAVFRRCLEVLHTPGNTLDDAEIYNAVAEKNDDVVSIIGAGKVHMYELQPSSARWRSKVGWLEIMDQLIRQHQDREVLGDGFIAIWEGSFLPEIAELARKTFNNFWEIGPQLSPAEWDEHTEVKPIVEFVLEDRTGEVIEFLDRAKEEQGEKSVLVISFGSVFAIPLLEQIRVLLATLVEMKIRFIFAQGICSDEIVAEVKRQCELSDNRGLLVGWMPQNAVLAHPATSFFLTHCGSNSVQEAILHSVPMIAWPGAVDQVFIALEMSQTHRVAFELLQIRTEYNIGRPTMRGPIVIGTAEAQAAEFRDVFTRMQGVEGEQMRERVRAMRDVMVQSCRTEGGRSYKAMQELGL